MKINLVVILALISISCSSNDPNHSNNIEKNLLPTQTPVSIEGYLEGSALDLLMRDDGIKELEENGVDVLRVNW